MSNKGIYCIVCTATDTTYIGSTCASFEKRWKKHKQRLRNGYHENSYLQNSWNKYGESNFEFLVLEKLNSKPDNYIIDRELHWINYFYPMGKAKCFNLSPVAGGGNTLSTDELRSKHSNAVKQSYTEDLIDTRRRHCIEFKTHLRLHASKSTEKWIANHAAAMRKLAKNPSWLAKMKEVNAHRQVPVHTDRGEYFDSVSDAARKTGAARANIRACINKKIESCMERKWYYTNENI